MYKGHSAWTPIENTYNQYITLDLGGRKKIRKIATLGRSRTKEFVTEFVILYSDDGELWKTYTDTMGQDQVKLLKKLTY
jgi:contactin associated protein-like 2